jgi:hypothetical protein
MDENIININILNISFVKETKNFYNLCHNNKHINIEVLDGVIPFGIEKFNNKIILNIELLKSNQNYNIITKIESLENELKKKFVHYNLMSVIKPSRTGINDRIIRTHYTNSTECYVLDKNKKKMIIDECNLTNTNCDINLSINGIWTNDNYFGLYIVVNNIKINKFNN